MTGRFDQRAEVSFGKGADADIGRLASRLRSEGWRVVQRGDERIDAVCGSRFMLRMFGCYMRIGRRNLPSHLEIRKDGAAPAVLDVRLYSDEGWYLLYVPEFARAYAGLFRRTIETIRTP
ncbi:hypothetical protein [Nocardiopsis suaedae]|uniref:Uncharacterized protein n=1 Tax=Nocardiopsis suaedae TaxID=3018444 RepID=A0ABT4TFJ8_9ACTN|nr:hypothetical protein [Nocardiopsis suaedae]MDA2802902.1 hypothetical protein [Nocardiopsis suaedae]